MITVGITGGIGSGKSTVCKIWGELGAYILNADDLAKQVMTKDPEVRRKIANAFGSESFREDGSLNRLFLAREAFHKGRVKELNAIVHPKLPQAVRKKMEEAQEKGCKVFVYEAALLLENLQPGNLDYVVLVLADENRRIERIKNRDNADLSQIRDRMDKQRDFQKAVDRVDYVMRNNGTLTELKRKAEAMYQNFLHSAS